jgi:acyl-coenzyme A synthetase/AMP-(fatty) acid ligase
MTTLPLLTHPHGSDVLAWSHGGAIGAAQFLSDVRRLAAAYPPGKHVLNAATDRYRFAVGFAAALTSDRISLLPPALTPEMVRQVRSFAPDVVCLTDHAQPAGVPLLNWDDVMAGSAPEPDSRDAPYDIPHIPADRIAAIVFTSGSTGAPIAHRKTWGGLVRSVRAEAGRLGLADGRRHSIVATVAPQHMYGFESTVLIALQSGAAMTASHPFYPADICGALSQASRPRMLVTTPIHLKTLLASGLDIPPVDVVLSATAPMPPQLAIAAEARLGVPLLEIYGSTETGQTASRRTNDTAEWTLFPGVTFGAGPGGIWARGGHIDEPVVLADEIELLDAHRFLLHGRTADLVNIAGKRSSLGYLNHQLNAVPGVVDGAFFMPDEKEGGDGTTRLVAFAVAPGMSVSALLAALRERVDAVFLPRPLVLLDALPRNSTGKLPREALQKLASEHQRRGPSHAQ